VKTENPSVCATMNREVCKSAIALYCLYLSVIKSVCVCVCVCVCMCVTEVLTNPIIRTRTRHFVTRTTLHVRIYILRSHDNQFRHSTNIKGTTSTI
jgi:hypothetical protein